MLPWFKDNFPLYLAPMAGVTDKIFRGLCKEQGADVVVTEFVSAEGVFRRNERTMNYLDFDPKDKARITALSQKAQNGELLPDERSELDEYLRVADVLAVLQSRARQALKTAVPPG